MATTKPAGSWTYEDLFGLPDDGKRHEIIYGELYELPPPSLEHQEILMRLVALLLPEVRSVAGRMLLAPVGVFMPGTEPVQPDLLVLTQERMHLRSERGIEGAPDLLVEVLSPGNTKHDRVTKRLLYVQGGVREYWLVDPQARSIEVLVLEDGEYRTLVQACGNEPVTSTVLSQLSFPASAVFEEG